MIQLFYGEEKYLLLKEKERIKKESMDLIQGVQIEVEELTTYSFFGKKTLLIETEKFENLDSRSVEILIDLEKRKGVTNDLIIFCDSVRKDNKLFQKFQESAEIIEKQKVEEQVFCNMVQDYVQKSHVHITEKNVRYLREYTGYYDLKEVNLSHVFQELDKLVSISSEITEKEIDTICKRNQAANAFHLVSAVVANDSNRVFHELELICEIQGETDIMGLILLLEQKFRVAYKRYLLEEKEGIRKKQDILHELNVKVLPIQISGKAAFQAIEVLESARTSILKGKLTPIQALTWALGTIIYKKGRRYLDERRNQFG